MKARFLLIVFAHCILFSGCTLSRNLLRTSVVQPVQYSNGWDLMLERHRFRKMARLELERARSMARAETDDYSCEPFSSDEERGFEAGFIDFLTYGGTGHPPPLPPRRYWWSGCDNLDDCNAIEDWFKGFHHGAAVAQASGYRDQVTVPLNDSLFVDTTPSYAGQYSEYSGQHSDTADVELIEAGPGQTDEPVGLGAILELPAPLAVEKESDESASDESGEATNGIKFNDEAWLDQAEGEPLDAEPEPLTDPFAGLELKDSLGSVSQSSTEIQAPPESQSSAESQPPTEIQPPTRIQAPTRIAVPTETQPPTRIQAPTRIAVPTETQPSSEDATAASEVSVGSDVDSLTANDSISTAEPQLPAESTEMASVSLLPPIAWQPKRETEAVTDSHLPPSVIAVSARQPKSSTSPTQSMATENFPDLPPSPALHAAQSAPMPIVSPKSEKDDSVQASQVQPKTTVDIQKSSVAAAVKPVPASKRTGKKQTLKFVSELTGGVVLIAVGLFLVLLVRRGKESIDKPNQQHAPRDSRWRWTAVCERATQTQNRISCRISIAASVMLAACLTTGCSSLTNPVLNGIPVRKLPTDLLAQPSRENMQTIPLSLLRQEQPKEYLLAAGDVMGLFIAGVFPPTLADQPLNTPPVYFPSQIDPLGAGLPPSLGYPVTIRNDGTLALPLVEPVSLEGLTVEEANERVRNAYTDKGILQPGRESVMLTLMQPRQIRVMVFRQEVGGFSAGGRGDISSNNVKQGTGHVVDLRAYENDVVNALANTGGLPGLDSYSGIFIFRGGQSNLELTQQLQSLPAGADLSELSDLSVKTDYIPTRWMRGEPLSFKPEDAILHEGDVVLLEARVKDLFYTAGLLPAGERVLPRDYDLDVVEAVVQVSGSLVNGAFGGNNFNGLLIQKGLGNPNPSALTVIRRTPNGGQIPIRVDLNRALTDPRERILVQPGDVLILQETRQESVSRYLNDLFNFNIFVQAFQRGSASGAAAVTQLPQ